MTLRRTIAPSSGPGASAGGGTASQTADEPVAEGGGRLRMPASKPAPRRVSLPEVVVAELRSAMRFWYLLLTGRLHQPRRHVGGRLTFGDGARADVFRETVAEQRRTGAPALLVIEFRLRAIHGRTHRLFERESILNTTLFAGFPGFVSKLWLTADQNEVYRGIYEWDGAAAAESYAEVMCRILRMVSRRGSVAYHVISGESRARFLAETENLVGAVPTTFDAWWRVS